MTTEHETQEGDRLRDSNWKRRSVIAALGSSGLFAAMAASQQSSQSSVGIGGGPMSDELSHLNLQWYEGPESELPSAGVEGRFFHVTSDGTNWTTGDVLRDDGNSWSKLDVGLGAARADSVDTDVATINNTVEVYIDPNGSDSNDGLSSSNPKQTINAAIDDAPVTPHEDQLVVNLASGTYTDSSTTPINLSDKPLSKVKISGSTDGSGNPDAVVDAESNWNYTLSVMATKVQLVNVKLQNAAGWNINARNNAVVDLVNCHIHDGTQRNVWIQPSAYMVSDDNCVFDFATNPDFSNITCTGDGMKLGGTVIGGGSQGTIRIKQGAPYVQITSNAVVDADNTGAAIRANDQADIKLQGEIKNAGTGVSMTRGCTLKEDTPTFTSVTTELKILSGSLAQRENGDLFQGMVSNSGHPSVSAVRDDPFLHYNDNENYAEYYNSGRSAWYEFGRELLTDGSKTVSAGSTAVVLSGGDLGDPLEAAVSIKNDPGADVAIDWYFEYNNSADVIYLVIEETLGNSSVDCDFKVWRVPR